MYDAPRAATPEPEYGYDDAPWTSPTPAGWVALAIWGGLTVIALIGAFGVVTAFSRMTEGLPPMADLGKITFSQQSVITDRNGVELARFGGE